MRRSLIAILVLFLAAIGLTLGRPQLSTRQLRVTADYGNLPLSFEANHGQFDDRVKFLSRGPGYSVFLTGDQAVLSLKARSGKTAVLRMRLPGANPAATIEGRGELPGKSNYFLGDDPSQWRTNVATYSKVAYRDIQPGIDLVYYGNQRQLEYDFVVAPGADPNAIRLRIEGADALRVAASGDLVVQSGGSEVHWRKPVIYQPRNGARQLVAGAYAISADRQISFQVGAYDVSRELVIDPTLVYSTLVSGSAYADAGRGIAVDAAGNAYITGITNSVDFPLANPEQASYGGNGDAYVAKLNPSGTALVYATFIGGSSLDQGNAIAVDASGNACIVGLTMSSNFPTMNAFKASKPGNQASFISKLNASGSALLFSSYIGGGFNDSANGVAMDSQGNAYVAGATTSTSFPVLNAYQSTNADSDLYSPFLSKFSASGTLVYSTYLGGSSEDIGYAVAVDSAGSAYVAGSAPSSNFPLVNAFQKTSGGAFITKFSPSGSSLVYSTYLGVPGTTAYGIAVDPSGKAYVTGSTYSGLPTTSNAFQTSLGGTNSSSTDAFVTVLNAAGSALVYSTYLGGSGADVGYGIAVDAQGNAYVTGQAASADFPTTSGAFGLTAPISSFQASFTASFNPSGSALNYSTYLANGSGSPVSSYAVAVDGSGNAYVTGATAASISGPGIPLTSGAFQTTSTSGNGGPFVMKIAPTNAIPTLASLSPASAQSGGKAFTLTVNGNNFGMGSTVHWNGSARGTSFVSLTQVTVSISAADIAAAGTASVTVVNPAPGGGESAPLMFTITGVTQPLPVLNQISPASATAGGPAFTLSLFGSSFTSASVVQWNGSARSTTFLSSTQLSAAITAADIASAGSATVVVFNPVPGGGTSAALTFTITAPNNPVPALTSLSPTSATAGGAGFTLTVTGGNFTSSSTVRWNGGNRTTTFVSASQLIAVITAADIATAGTAAVTIFNPTPGGGTSNAINFTINAVVANNPVPSISFLSPSTASAGGGIFTLTVNGSGFVSGSIVRWDGATRSTTFVNATQLTAVIAASDIANPGTGLVSVFNPTPGGGTSNVSGFVIAPPSGGNPVGTISTISPATVLAGAAQFTITVNGGNFQTSSVVRWNGLNRTTAYVGATQLQATIYAADVVYAGTAQVSVFTPPPGGGVSNVVSFTITAPTANPLPTITELLPGGIFAGTATFAGDLTIGGSNFVSGSIVQWNGQSRVTSYVASSTLSATLLASDVATPGTALVTVLNPGGVVSASFTFTVLATPSSYPVPSITSLSPPGFEAGQFLRVLTINGTGFTPASKAFWNGSAAFTTYISSTVLSVNLAASNISTVGAFQVTVSNPSPGGGPSPVVNTTVVGAPTFPVNGIISGVTFDATQLPSAAGIGSMFGVNLAPATLFASTIPLPTTLGGVAINVNGILAPLFFVSQGQINFQFPWELVGLTQLTVTINNNGVVSPPQTINLQLYAPGIFTLNQQGTGQAAVQIANTSTFAAPAGSIAGQLSRPAQRGEYISIFCGGLGPVSNPPADGDLAGSSPLSSTIVTPTVTIGGVSATVSFSGLAPGFAGLYQVNVQVPNGAPSGNNVTLAMSVGGSNSNQVTIAVQ